MFNFEKYEDELIALRREFHKIPEIAFNEFKTSEKIKEYLRKIGITDIKEYAKTGVAATVYGKNKGKTIALRADIDALPINEENEVSYKSVHDGMMHACGHDSHIAINLITAKILFENKDKLNGNVKFIFQPAEEGNGGAELMIKEGVLENPLVNCVLGGHLWPGIETGKIDITYGTTFAASARVKITVKGKGGHAAIPAEVKDCVYSASRVVIALKDLSRKLNLENITNVLSLCSFDCKSVYNIYNDNAYLGGTLRTLTINDRDFLRLQIENAVNEIAKEDNIAIECEVIDEYPPLINNEKILSVVFESAKKIIGEENIVSIGSEMASEDFAYFSQSLPSAHIKIGTAVDNYNYPLHNPKYNINEKSLLIAVKIFTESIIDLMGDI